MKIVYLFLCTLLISCTTNYKKVCELCYNITFKELENKIDSKEIFVTVIKNNECSICKEYNYILDKYINKNNISIYSIDSKTLDITNDSVQLLITEIKDKTGIKDNAILPSTLFYFEGILINVEIGILSYEELSFNIDLLFSL